MKLALQTITSMLFGLVFFGAALFLPAGTFDYWQAWVFIAVFAVTTMVPSIYLGLTNPDALRRRMQAGPMAEKRTAQKILSACAFLSLIALMVFSAFDHRFGWSPVPTAVTWIGNALVAIGLGLAMLVVIQNAYAAANVKVEAGQTVASTGLYGLVRHPMYVGNVIMMVGIPLALDSYWGLVWIIPAVAGLAARILDEEKMLREELTGYAEYADVVPYRLVPHVW